MVRQKFKIGNKLTVLCTTVFLFYGCTLDNSNISETIPDHDKKYGIYSMDLITKAVELIYSSDNSLHRVHENPVGTKLIFQEDFGGNTFHDSEICLINPDGTGYQRITSNLWLDAYPSWSPDGTKILFLSWLDYPDNTLDIFVMNSNGTNPLELYDSGFHDADPHWVGTQIVFTRESQIWIMEDNGTNARQVTGFEFAGQQGNANLPLGDYDPRLNPTGDRICFDRMVDDQSTSGNYDFYKINTNGTEETAITSTGWQQFMAEWSHAGDQLLFTVAAKGGGGIFDMYTMNPDGSDLTNITPADWPAEFLCSYGIYSYDDLKIYFVGEWWE
jgi:Tol biopolymer transport system component